MRYKRLQLWSTSWPSAATARVVTYGYALSVVLGSILMGGGNFNFALLVNKEMIICLKCLLRGDPTFRKQPYGRRVLCLQQDLSNMEILSLVVFWKVSLVNFQWPITMAARSKVRTVFARPNTGIVGSNPAWGMDICMCFYSVFVLSCVCM
jgi:hypothetical protein